MKLKHQQTPTYHKIEEVPVLKNYMINYARTVIISTIISLMLPDKYKLASNPICQSAVESRWLLKAEHLKLEELTTSACAHITKHRDSNEKPEKWQQQKNALKTKIAPIE